MNAVPIFTDSRGKKFKRFPRKNEWTPLRMILGVVLVLASGALSYGAGPTLVDLTANVKGILPKVNGGAGADMSSVTFPGSGTLMTTATGVSAAQLPNPTASTIGGVQSKDCTSGSQFVQKINTDGTVTCATPPAAPNFADAETPSGTINGSNVTFTLAHTPNPTASLNCAENGVQQRVGAGLDFTLSGATITYATAPPTNTTISCFYRF